MNDYNCNLFVKEKKNMIGIHLTYQYLSLTDIFFCIITIFLFVGIRLTYLSSISQVMKKKKPFKSYFFFNLNSFMRENIDILENEPFER